MLFNLVLEKTLESPLVCKEIQPIHPKGDQSWVFIERTHVEAETPRLWPPDAKSWLIWKDSDAGTDWGQEEKGTTEDEMFDGIMTRWTCVWVDSGSWWWTGKPGMLRFTGSQRVGHDWTTELKWTVLYFLIPPISGFLFCFHLFCFVLESFILFLASDIYLKCIFVNL